MGGRSKKISRSKRLQEPIDEDALVRKRASVKAIKTWNDVAHDSEDEFDASRDKVLLEYENKVSKRNNKASDYESDEEVFGVTMADSFSEAGESEDDVDADFYSDENEDTKDGGSGPQIEEGAWGKQKYNYYDADDIGTDSDDDEAAAKEEEEEALRLQKQQLEMLDEEDFMDGFSAQLGVSTADSASSSISRLVSSVDDSQAHIDLDKISLSIDGAFDISDAKHQALLGLPEKEKLKIIQAESPELLSLVDDMKRYWIGVRSDIKPIIDKAASLGVSGDDHPALAFYTVKYQLLMSYLNNIAVYLVIKASTAEERGGVELRDHPVIASIVEFRRRLEMMDALQHKLTPLLDLFADELASGAVGAKAAISGADKKSANAANSVFIDDSDSEMVVDMPGQEQIELTSKSKNKRRNKSKESEAFLKSVAMPVADSYAELQRMLKKEKKGDKKHRKSREQTIDSWEALTDGDFGEQEHFDENDAKDKERAIRRLRHHAKRIAQARSKRDNKTKLTGDMDVPYKDRKASERLRFDDKTADEIRKQASRYGDDLDMGMDLDSNVGEADDGQGSDNGDNDDYYKEVLSSKAKKDAEKQARKQAHWKMMVEANEAEDAAVDDNAKRNVNYQILKNKGMMPRRTKEQRNPRVKRRKRYETAKKKLSSTVAQVRTQEGAYGGEATGIKANLTRSTRFA
ncbi:something about silencing protein 10 [Coemansia spiralis]|uniref:Something about silencing protein 10 n=2 Tax=Coemansia TaxID=4863 RepID=A0A9W8G0W4_9FUNG|nr:something about silencing protein 10 [Coemansia umbellata]KAJ2619776.1 something about silencing protein 10 [Coemansia sp. RSA 1358]KAJ2669327.1 something about silencing protein 10 [Coemansia spiralis]